MFNKISLGITLILLGLITACIPYEEEVITDIDITYKDPIAQKIFDFQDQQNIDSLVAYFGHSNATYRYLAAMAFASIKPDSIDQLALLLYDPVDKVRATAAYAIGQSKNDSPTNTLLKAFERKDTAGVYKNANKAILAAVGKKGDERILENLASIKTYQKSDTLLLEGQAWGMYRFATRQISSPLATQRMVEFVTDKEYPFTTRLIAANYLYRLRDLTLTTEQTEQLLSTVKEEEDPVIKMTLIVGLGKTKDDNVLSYIQTNFDKESDYRVQCNMLRALGNYDYTKVFPLVEKAVKNTNEHVSHRAAQLLLDHGQAVDATFYWRLAKDSACINVKPQLYRVSNKLLPAYYVEHRNNMNAEIRQAFIKETDIYKKADYLTALGEFGWNYKYISREAKKSKNSLIKTTGITAVKDISDRADFNQFFNTSKNSVRYELSRIFLEGIQSNDPGVIEMSASALQNPDRNYAQFLQDSVHLFKKKIATLNTPVFAEAKKQLSITAQWFEGIANVEEGSDSIPPIPTLATEKIDTEHRIDWSVYENYTDIIVADINTSKGKITIELLPNYAPGSVANFIKLSKDGFYDGIAFHRVVPNFVIQAGCPRGDGYGGADHTIRSELPYIHYDKQGYVGMASSGNHTESSQFFITHSPTLHLDGNYTIFAKVTSGMDVVHKIQRGDVIETVIVK